MDINFLWGQFFGSVSRLKIIIFYQRYTPNWVMLYECLPWPDGSEELVVFFNQLNYLNWSEVIQWKWKKATFVKTIQWIVTNPTGIVWVVNFVGTPLMDGQSWNVTLWSPRCWKIWPIGSTYVLHHDFQDFHGTLCSPRSPLVHSDWSHRVCPRYKACLSLQLDTKQPETCIYIILWAHYFTTYICIYIHTRVYI